jgi:hypothetical protein
MKRSLVGVLSKGLDYGSVMIQSSVGIELVSFTFLGNLMCQT